MLKINAFISWVVALSSDPGHFEIFRRGPKAWNAWREQNPTTIPELAGIALKLSERQMGPANGGPINLKAARLQDAFLRFATLSASNLEAADLSGADLVHARFDDADLSAANLSNALLDHVDFSGANLRNVNLCGASLPFATLSAADLEAADMSGTDLVHARFDDANLSAANLSNALLDHADFSGANLRNVNLSGASLYHAKKLTQAQLEESIGSDSTILPPHLRGSVSWSVARSQTETTALDRRDLGPQARHAADVDVPRISSYKQQPVWIAGVLLIGAALVITGFVWQHMNEAVAPASGAQRGSEPSVIDPKLSLDTEGQKMDPEHPPSAEVAILPLPSGANPADRTEIRPEPSPVPGTDAGAIVAQETNAEPRGGDGLNRSDEQTRNAPGEDSRSGNGEASKAVPLVFAEPAIVGATDLPAEASDPSVPVSIESVDVTYRHGTHGTVPDTELDAQDTSAPAAPPIISPNSMVRDLPAEAAVPDTSSASVTEAPTQSLGLSTPPTPSLSDALTPSAAAVPFSDQKEAETELPHDAVSIPMPVRKPVTETSLSKPGAEIIPKPGKDSVAHPD